MPLMSETVHRVSVLCVSRFRELALLRQRVLELEGFEVIRPETKAECMAAIASARFDCLLICHSISADSAREVMDEFRRRNPRGCLIAILASPWARGAYQVDVSISGTDGPDVLVETVRNCEQAHKA